MFFAVQFQFAQIPFRFNLDIFMVRMDSLSKMLNIHTQSEEHESHTTGNLEEQK